MPRVEALEKYLRETSNAGFRGPKKPKWMAEHRNHGNRPVDGRDKNDRTQALGMTRNRVFLQSRYVTHTGTLVQEVFWIIIEWLARVGLFAFLFFAARRLQLGQASLLWPETPGTIVSSEVSYVVNPSAGNSYAPEIEYTYCIDGVVFKSRRLNYSLSQGVGGRDLANATAKKYRPGRKVTVRFNPSDPTQAVIEPGIDVVHSAITVGLGTIIFGTLGFMSYLL